MQMLPIDVVGLVATIMGISIVLVPVLGLTARFALKPTVEALSKFFEQKELGESVHILERRMALMEQQIESVQSSVERLVEIREFHRELKEPEEAPRLAGSDASEGDEDGSATAARPTDG